MDHIVNFLLDINSLQTKVQKFKSTKDPFVESLASFKLGLKYSRTNNFYLQERRLKGEQQGNAGRFFER